MKKPNKKIWDKFSPRAKRAWSALYRDFFFELKLQKKYPKGAKIELSQMAVIAHNMACYVGWYLDKNIFKKEEGDTDAKD